jgi:hypothetical protein
MTIWLALDEDELLGVFTTAEAAKERAEGRLVAGCQLREDHVFSWKFTRVGNQRLGHWYETKLGAVAEELEVHEEPIPEQTVWLAWRDHPTTTDGHLLLGIGATLEDAKRITEEEIEEPVGGWNAWRLDSTSGPAELRWVFAEGIAWVEEYTVRGGAR